MSTGLTPLQQAILVDLLVHGDDKAGNIANRTGHHRNAVSSHLGPLTDESLLQNKGEGVYTLTDRGAEAARGLLKSGYNPYTDPD